MKMTPRAIRSSVAVIALFAFASFDAVAGDAGGRNHYILGCGSDCTGRWVLAGSLTTARWNHTATLLGNGKVLVAGGSDDNGALLARTELYDPATGAWSVTGPMHRPRAGHFAFLLPAGGVLVLGGDPCCMSNVTAEVFDQDTGSWSPAGGSGPVFGLYGATMLPSGKIFLAGGTGAWLYDPLQQTWTQASADRVYRQWPHTVLLPDSTVLMVGGSQDADDWVVAPGAEVYNPTTGAWGATGSPNSPREKDVTIALADGSVLATGGFASINYPQLSPESYPTAYQVLLRSSEVYGLDGAWHQVGDLNEARSYHTVTLLPDGRLLAAGGLSSEIQINPWPLSSLRSAEVYEPATAIWRYTASLNIARGGHTATLLNGGTVLVVGGSSIGYGVLGSAEMYLP